VKALLLAATGAAVVLSLVGCGAAPITGAEPGATLAGPIELVREGKNGTIGGGDLEITVSDDGTGITEASLKLSDMSCSNESGSIRVESGGWSTTTKYVRRPSPTEGSTSRSATVATWSRSPDRSTRHPRSTQTSRYPVHRSPRRDRPLTVTTGRGAGEGRGSRAGCCIHASG
jgi:hypothetical protein